jgi:hypothetical protein
MPGSSWRDGFGNTARNTTEPVDGSTETSDTGVLRAVLEREADFRLVVRHLHELAVRELALQAQHLGGRLRDVDVDGIELLDRRERALLPRRHERALGDERAPDASRDRRQHLRVHHVDARGLDGGACRGHVGLGACA